jgi:predicted dehydrogenase
MPDTVRVGLISTSWWADAHHLPSLKSHPRAEVAAICGRNRDRADEMAAKYGIPAVYTDYREMIEKAGLDAVLVAAPDDQHFAMTMAALEAGLHVICEKPLAANLEEAGTMYAKAEEMGVKHMTYFTWRWLPHYRYLKALLEQGQVGDCFHAHISWLNGLGRRGNYWWRFDNERADGILGDIGSHMIDFARWYVGDVAKVSATLSTFIERPGLDGRPLAPANDSALLTLEFKSGAHGVIHVSAVAHTGGRGFEQNVRLHGQGGSVELHATSNSVSIHGARHDEPDMAGLVVPDEYFAGVANKDPFGVFTRQSVGSRLFIDAILNDTPITPSFYDGLKVQEVIDAAIRSDRTGHWIMIE